MFAVEVRDSIMVAHSMPDPFFGPAANKHGATFIVDGKFLTSARLAGGTRQVVQVVDQLVRLAREEGLR